jgi:type I restriction enzyme, S subunit
MKQKHKRLLTPKLRFPEFGEQWDEVLLSHLANSISDRVGKMPCIPYTVTSGLGLVSQEEKLGRTIAGNSLRNYIRLQKDDFAYNKSATKAYPEGYIARYLDEAKAAVPNSIFTCFRVDSEKVDPAYLDFLFAGNLHGRWLRKFLTIGARAHGSLNVSDDDLMALPVPLPSSPEQQKIAECLSSLDGLIAAEGQKLAALRDHKRGLMQRLFPQPGQTQPRLRFPEFRDKGEWEEKPLGKIAEIKLGKMLDKNKHRSGRLLPYLNNLAVRWNDFDTSDLPKMYFNENELEKYELKKGDVIVCEGGEPGRSAVWDERLPSLKFQKALHRVRFKIQFVPHLLVHYLETIAGTPAFESLFTGGGIKHLTRETFSHLAIPIASPAEQRRIAACLAALDTQIAAQAAKIEALKQHKRGLMQQLFPAPEEQ